VERELMSGEVGGGGGGGQLWRNQSSPVRANFQQHTREGLAGTPSEGIQPSSGSSKPLDKYGVRSPAVLIGRGPATPLHPPHLVSYTRVLLVSQDRRDLFVTPCCNPLRMTLYGDINDQHGGCKYTDLILYSQPQDAGLPPTPFLSAAM
jgi:hypothetical protein